MDWDKLLRAMVPLGVALARPGQSGASFVQGFQGADQMMWERRQQEEETARRNTMAQAEMANREHDNQRQDQMARLNRLAMALQQLQPAVDQQADYATDPTQAESSLLQRTHQLESSFELPPAALAGYVPPMAPMISAKKIKRAKAKVAELMSDKLYGNKLGDVADSLKIQEGEFAGMSVRELLSMAEMEPPPPSTPKPVNKQLQSKEFMKGGKRVVMNFDPDTGEYQEVPGINPIVPANAQQQGGLPPRVQSRVDQTAKGFDTQPIVRNIQKQAEAVQFANSLDPNTTNPADDQALIYAFAKAMDPDSVVREGEYATVQKYAQSWAETFGFNAARIFSNTSFLSSTARRNMKTTIQKKYAASKTQYDNLRKSYGSRIDKITGDPGTGESWLIDYAAGFPELAPTSSPAQSKPAEVGEERLIGGVRARWDGKGWIRVD